jgi:hypothetical protein
VPREGVLASKLMDEWRPWLVAPSLSQRHVGVGDMGISGASSRSRAIGDEPVVALLAGLGVPDKTCQ